MVTAAEQKPLTHFPALAAETVALLTGGRRNGAFRLIDGTLGCGGHAALILKQNPEAEMLGLDRDPEALERSASNLRFAAGRCTLVNSDFADMKAAAAQIGWDHADAILLDLGVSSPQLDDPRRGFSFRSNGPLDMRMDPASPRTAARILNTYSEAELTRVFREYGELRAARVLARATAAERKKKPFATTLEFAVLCEKVLRRGARRGGPPVPALPFQALRIEVNDELGQLRTALEAALELLTDGGVLAVITFQSLEDHMVKHFFADMAAKCKCPPGLPVCVCRWQPKLEVLTKKPVTASAAEMRRNPRSACAKLRAAKRLKKQESPSLNIS